MTHRPRIAVLGAGIQGACMALALRREGFPVTLIDKRPAPLLAASRRNEGKIHLGFVYALDDGGRTRRRMLDSALKFSGLIDRWCGPQPWERWSSRPFSYWVMPDSIAGQARIETAYEELRGMLGDSDASLGYLGRKLSWMWRRARPGPGSILAQAAPDSVLETEERAVYPGHLSDALTAALGRDAGIELLMDTRVERAERRPGGYSVHGVSGGRAMERRFDIVVNCSWEDRARIDGTAGAVTSDQDHCYRVKYQILVRPRQALTDLTAVTMTLGPYGDVVPWSEDLVYISWYPECRVYFDRVPPESSFEDAEDRMRVARRSLDALSDLFPRLRDADILESNPGIIVAAAGVRGTADIQDPGSSLHRRSSFGARSRDGWWTIDTGKLTSAPANAEDACRQICQAVVGAHV